MGQIDPYSDLLLQLYATACEENGWTEFLRTLTREMRSSTAALMFHAKNGSVVHLDWGIDPDATRLYEQHFWQVDEWYLRARSKSHAGWVAPSQTLISTRELEKTEFYNDLLSHYDMVHQCGAVLEHEDSRISVLSLIRGAAAEPFDNSEVTLLRALIPHIQRAIQVYRKLSELELKKQTFAWSLDKVSFGIILLQQDGTVYFANRGALELASRANLDIRTKGISLVDSAQNRHLQALIASARVPRIHCAGGGLLKITSPSGEFPTLVSPLRLAQDRMIERNYVAIFISDPGATINVSDALQHLYQLTPAEVRVASALADGKGLPECAEIMRVSIETAKSQLKGIFQKTGTHKQAQLVRLLMSLAHVDNSRNS